MMHVIDASEGVFDSGRYPEVQSLCVRASHDNARPIGIGPVPEYQATVMNLARVIMPRSRAPLDLSMIDEDPRHITAWGRRPAHWALRQPARIDLSLVLLEGLRFNNAQSINQARSLGMFRHIAFVDAHDAQSWIQAGLPAARVTVNDPASYTTVTSETSRHSRRTVLEVGDDEIVIMPIAAPWCSLDSQRLAFLLGMLRVNGYRATALVPSNAWRLAGARQFCRRGGLGARLIVIDGPMTPWLSACDVAFVDAARPRQQLASVIPRGAIRVLVAQAQASGVPVAIAPGSLLDETKSPAGANVTEELRPLLNILEQKTCAPTFAVAENCS